MKLLSKLNWKIILSIGVACIYIISSSHIPLKQAICSDLNAKLQSGWLYYLPDRGAAPVQSIHLDESKKMELDAILSASQCWRILPFEVRVITGGYYQLGLNYENDYGYIVIQDSGLIMITHWTKNSAKKTTFMFWMPQKSALPMIECLKQFWVEHTNL